MTTVAEIAGLVSAALGVALSDMLTPRRDAPLCRAREMTILLARRRLGLSLQRIGESLGGRGHAAVRSALANAERRLADDPAWAERVAAIDREIAAAQAAISAAPSSPDRKKSMDRSCLCCGGAFRSRSAGNRLCRPCKQSAAAGLPEQML
jgi:hypothetical protein